MKMKKLLKKAMAFALAASMLVAMPLDASAGLIDAYKITDGSGKLLSGKEDESTGTVSNTFSETGTYAIKHNDAKIVGIVLDQEYVSTTAGKKVEFNATVILDNELEDPADLTITDENGKPTSISFQDVINKYLRWSISDISKAGIEVKEVDRTKATFRAEHGTKLGEEVNVTVTLGTPKGTDGSIDYTYTDANGNEQAGTIEGFDKVYSATAKVYIKEYATSMKLNVPVNPYVKHTADMNDYVEFTPKTANETIVSWSISDSNPKKIATITKAGVVTFKKEGTITIKAMSETGKVATVPITITKGNPAKTIALTEISHNDNTKSLSGTSITLDLAEGYKENVTDLIQLKATITTENGQDTTDYIDCTSSSKKVIEVVTSKVTNVAGNTATLTVKPLKTGSSTITVKTTNGAKAKLKITVKASLVNGAQALTIDKGGTTKLYSGQTLQLGLKKVHPFNTDSVKWEVVKLNNGSGPKNSNATVSKTGLLTIANKISTEGGANTVEVRAYVSKANVLGSTTKTLVQSEKISITVEQSYIDGFTVTDGLKTKSGGSYINKPLADVIVKGNHGNHTGTQKDAVRTTQTVNMFIGQKRSITASLKPGGTIEVDGESTLDTQGTEESLNWKTSSAKVASISGNGGEVTITANAKGTATITVSGVYKKKNSFQLIKATFKVKVTQATTSLTMNKTSAEVIAKKNAAQKVSLSVTKNKNAAGTVNWTIDPDNNSNVSINNPTKAATKKTVTFKKNTDTGYTVGEKFTVTATASDTLIKAKSTITVVNVTDHVTLNVLDSSNIGDAVEKGHIFDATTATAAKSDTITITYSEGESSQSITLDPRVYINSEEYATAGDREKYTESVTYTVSGKKSAVKIIDNTVYITGKGTATITAKTASGKKAIFVLKIV